MSNEQSATPTSQEPYRRPSATDAGLWLFRLGHHQREGYGWRGCLRHCRSPRWPMGALFSEFSARVQGTEDQLFKLMFRPPQREE